MVKKTGLGDNPLDWIKDTTKVEREKSRKPEKKKSREVEKYNSRKPEK